jgi:hypothetical protein
LFGSVLFVLRRMEKKLIRTGTSFLKLFTNKELFLFKKKRYIWEGKTGTVPVQPLKKV